MTLPIALRRTRGLPRRLLLLLTAGLVAACASTPLPPPPWQTVPPAGVVAPSEPKPQPVPRAAPPARPAPAVASPVAPPVVAEPARPLAEPPAAAPYGPELAARFPEPRVSYRTPAFEPGRIAFTSNAELQSLLRGLSREGRGGGTTARLLPLGRSQSGTPIEALLLTRLPDASPDALARGPRPTVLLIGQQHGDEPAGAEALLVIAQELVQGSLAALLDRINVIVLPRANPDGAQAGSRLTAGGIDANRDHLLLRTPEAQAQAQLLREYRPAVVVDAHEHTAVGRWVAKFGGVQRFDVLLQYATTANLPAFVTRAAEEWFRRPLIAALDDEGLTHEWYYTTSLDLADRKVSMGGVQPDTARNVNGLRHAVSLLIETRGAGLGRLHLGRRVHTQVVAATNVLRSTAARAEDLIKLRQFVDAEVSAQACQGELVVLAGPTPSEKTLLMLDPQTGRDKPVLVAWDSALELRPLKLRARPCGYWLSADQADAVMRLRALGVTVQQFEHKAVLRGETFRETAREAAVRDDVRGRIADGAGVLRVQVELVSTLLDVAPGSYFVPLAQPLAHLVVAALEPDTQNSFLASGIVTGVDRAARLLALPEGTLPLLP